MIERQIVLEPSDRFYASNRSGQTAFILGLGTQTEHRTLLW